MMNTPGIKMIPPEFYNTTKTNFLFASVAPHFSNNMLFYSRATGHMQTIIDDDQSVHTRSNMAAVRANLELMKRTHVEKNYIQDIDILREFDNDENKMPIEIYNISVVQAINYVIPRIQKLVDCDTEKIFQDIASIVSSQTCSRGKIEYIIQIIAVIDPEIQTMNISPAEHIQIIAGSLIKLHTNNGEIDYDTVTKKFKEAIKYHGYESISSVWIQEFEGNLKES